MTETSAKDLSTEKMLPGKGSSEPTTASPATAEAIKHAPAAMKKSMPMALSIGAGILLAGVVGWLAHYLVWLILVLYLSFIGATIMEAPVSWLRRRGMRRGMAAIIVMVGTAALVFAALYFLANGVYGQVAALKTNLQNAPEHINNYVNGVKHHFLGAGDKLNEFDIGKTLQGAWPSISTLWTNAMWGVETISWLVIMFFIVMYMLVDGADHLKAGRALLPKRSRLEATKLFNEIAKAHRGWALASLANVVSASILTGTGLYFLGIPGAYLLGFVAGLGELIPNIGPFLGALPAIALTAVADPEKLWWVLGMFVVVQTVQSYTISPQMLKFSIELPVLVTIISVLVFGILFGFLGILVAIPLVADMVVVWQYINRHMEKDTEDYDVVNAAVDGRRATMSPDNTSPSRLRKMFQRSRQANAADGEARPSEGRGMAGLEAAEKKSSNT